MASTGLMGPFILTNNTTDRNVTLKSLGAYTLGNSNTIGIYIVRYVGRSDDDVNKRLKNRVGKYIQFKFGYYNSPKASFEKECFLYHDFGGNEEKLDNYNHPQRPAETNWECPKCTIFDWFYLKF